MVRETLEVFTISDQTLHGEWSELSVYLMTNQDGLLYREDLMEVLTSTEDGLIMLMGLEKFLASTGLVRFTEKEKS